MDVTSQSCRCGCGAVQFRVRRPLFRLYCHCTLCQRFNQAPFADVTVFRAKDVDPPARETVSLQTLRPPPNVPRGRCARCEQPAIEYFSAPLLPKLVMVPKGVFAADAPLPAPALHLFYDMRSAEVDDPLPKYRGYLRSQLAFARRLIAGFARGQRP